MSRKTLYTLVLLSMLLAIILPACGGTPIEVGATFYVHQQKLVNPNDLGDAEWLKKQNDNCRIEKGAVNVIDVSINGAVLVSSGNGCKGWVTPSVLRTSPPKNWVDLQTGSPLKRPSVRFVAKLTQIALFIQFQNTSEWWKLLILVHYFHILYWVSSLFSLCSLFTPNSIVLIYA